MARARDQFRQSDVTTWGVVALVCGGLALLTANISALVPDSVFAGLHSTRLGGATVNEMHSELSNVEDEQARLRATSAELSNRLDGADHDFTTVRQRISALEVTVPTITEALNTRAQTAGVDQTLVTGSIGSPPLSFSKPVRGPEDTDSVTVTRTPLLPAMQQPATAQPMPQALTAQPAPVQPAGTPSSTHTSPTLWAEAAVPGLSRIMATSRPDVVAEGAITEAKPASASAAPAVASVASSDAPVPMPAPSQGKPAAVASVPAAAVQAPAPAHADVRAIGIAVGVAVPQDQAFSAWQVLAAKVGVMLVGTSPLLADNPLGGQGKVLVAGPLADLPTATRLCANIQQAGVPCTPMPYVGSPVVPAGN